MGLSLKERYQEEALKEGKKIEASILPLASDLREVQRWRSNEQRRRRKTLGLGWDSSFSRSCKKRKKKKTSPYIAKAMGPTT